MTRQDGLRVLEQVLQLPSQTLTGEEMLADLESWDSLSTLAFIAEVDKQFSLPLQGRRVAGCRTVNELIRLLGVSADRAA